MMKPFLAAPINPQQILVFPIPFLHAKLYSLDTYFMVGLYICKSVILFTTLKIYAQFSQAKYILFIEIKVSKTI